MDKEIRKIIEDMDFLKGIYRELITILPSFNITDKKVLPYGLKPHTRSVSWLVEQVITQQTKYRKRRLGLDDVKFDMPATCLHDCEIKVGKEIYYINVKIHNIDKRENKNDIAAVEKLYMQYSSNPSYNLIYACFGIAFKGINISFDADYLCLFSPQFLPIYVNPRNDKIQAYYHHKPIYRTRNQFFKRTSERVNKYSIKIRSLRMEEILNKIFNEDILNGIDRIPDNSVDLVLSDPPYCLGKDYGNNSDKRKPKDYLEWSKKWIDAVIPKIKNTGSFYIFLTWQYSPEIFSYMKSKLIMINEIIWDRRVPSMGGSTRKFSSVHDNIGFFVKSRKYYFDLDSVRIPYDPETKKARTRSIFAGKKWLEVGYNPKDLWSVSRIHAQDPEREDHPTQKPLKIVERIIKASCPEKGVVLDPFMGSGTTAAACAMLNRDYIGFEINEQYCRIIQERLEKLGKDTPLFSLENEPEEKDNEKIEEVLTLKFGDN